MSENSKNLFLTFDDGPSVPYTNDLLDLLKEYQIKATFFVCGKNAQRYPQIIGRICAEGHALGNHAYSHSWSNILSKRLFNEFIQTGSILENICRYKVKLARAPWGLMRKSVREELLAQGFKIFRWDFHVYDWWQPPVNYMAKKIIASARPGAIILLHDGGKTNVSTNRRKTIEALRIAIPALAKEGYSFAKLE